MTNIAENNILQVQMYNTSFQNYQKCFENKSYG